MVRYSQNEVSNRQDLVSRSSDSDVSRIVVLLVLVLVLAAALLFKNFFDDFARLFF